VSLKQLISEADTAQTEVARFIDTFISSFNPYDHEAQEQWRPTEADEHPSMQRNSSKSERSSLLDRVNLIKQVNSHTRCGPHCQRIDKRTHRLHCRFGYPKRLLSHTQLIYEPCGRNENGSRYYAIHIETKRNDTQINNFNPIFIDYWRGNMDIQFIVDPVKCAQYIAKYTAKAEKISNDCLSITQKLLSCVDDSHSNTTILRKIMLQSNGRRDYGAPEIQMHNLQLQLGDTDCSFISECVSDQRVLRRHAKSPDTTFRESLRAHFTKRVEFCYSTKFPQLNVDNLNFVQFAMLFELKDDSLQKRKFKKNAVLNCWPNIRCYSRDKNYNKYCKFQLIKYKPWKENPLNLLKDYSSEIQHSLGISTFDDFDENTIDLDCFQLAWDLFLQTSYAKKVIPLYYDDVRQARDAYKIYDQENTMNFEDLAIEETKNTEEWMDVLQLNPMLDELKTQLEDHHDWSEPFHAWTSTQRIDMLTWLNQEEKSISQTA